MLTLILLVGLVYWIGTTFGDSAGVAATAIAVVLLLIMVCRGFSEAGRAGGNWIRYWSRGEEPGRRSTCRSRTRRTERSRSVL